MNGECTVLVTSCDAYRDVEGPFLTLFRKYWPDCPFELVVNGETGAVEGFDRAILSGNGKSWSEMLVEALDGIDTPYVIMMMNDYFLEKRVDTALVLRRLGEAKAANALNYRLSPTPPRAMKNTAYAVSCKVGIWNREFLRNLALKTSSAWDFERRGSFLFEEDDIRPLMVTDRLEFPFMDVIHKGYWERCGVDLLKREGIAYDFSKRGLPPFMVRVCETFKAMVFAIFPLTLIVRLQNAVGKRT